MSYSIVFTSFADRDLEEAAKWYESKRALLGWEFRNEVSSAIDKIMDDRVDYQIFTDKVRKLRLIKFPYHIFYIKDHKSQKIVVLGLFHFKTNPEKIKRLLG